MKSPEQARHCMCVLKPGHRETTSLAQRSPERLLWWFFPWVYRKIIYRGWFCIADDCEAWRWGDRQKTIGQCGLVRQKDVGW